MLSIEIIINGKPLYVAGHKDAQLLNTLIWSDAKAVSLRSFVGVVGIGGEMETLSYPNKELAIGDEITIRVIDTLVPDQPTETVSRVPGVDLQSGS